MPIGVPGGRFYTSATPLPGGGTAPAGYMTIEGTFSFADGQARVFLVFIFGNGAPTVNVQSRYVTCDVVGAPQCGWVFDGSWSRAFDGGPVSEYHWYDASGTLLGNGPTLAPPAGVDYPIWLSVVNSAGFVGSTSVGEAAGPQRSGDHGWVWANQTTAASYTPATGYQYNSTGASNSVTRSSAGRYTVRFAGLGGSGGNVQVTAYGSDAAYCKSAGWWTSGSDLLANVRCFSAAGQPVDSRFNALFYREQISGGSGATTAYLWANASTSADYTPASGYSYNDTGASNRVRRSGTGNYTVELPGLTDSNASVQVTAYGTNADRCQAAGWYTLAGQHLRRGPLQRRQRAAGRRAVQPQLHRRRNPRAGQRRQRQRRGLCLGQLADLGQLRPTVVVRQQRPRRHPRHPPQRHRRLPAGRPARRADQPRHRAGHRLWHRRQLLQVRWLGSWLDPDHSDDPLLRQQRRAQRPAVQRQLPDVEQPVGITRTASPRPPTRVGVAARQFRASPCWQRRA